jgi:pyridoxal phosphate enzyme (YggS family)
MSVNKANYTTIKQELDGKKVVLVAVSKTKPAEEIQELYELGHRDFGENYVQELVEKQEKLPNDIHWHFIGHLQSNKVKYIAPFISLIQSVDSVKLLKEINKQAAKNDRIIDVLLQMHIAQEETKFGLDEKVLEDIITNSLSHLKNVRVTGLMGMASFTENAEQVRKEFQFLRSIFDKYKSKQLPNLQFTTLSMGMSGDYQVAIEEGSNMVRIGSLLFGARQYS